MKKLPWLVIALLPACLGLKDWRHFPEWVPQILFFLSLSVCIFAAFGLLNGFIRNVWLQLLAAAVIGPGFLMLDRAVEMAISGLLYPWME